MKNVFFLLPLMMIGSTFTSCDTIRALKCNKQAVEMSTVAICENIQAIEESNESIAENKRQLEAINRSLEGMSESN